MHLSILISSTTSYRNVAWSICECAACQSPEAARIEDQIETVSVWFIPVSRSVKGRIGRCDFCERLLGPARTNRMVAVDEWSPSDELNLLIEKLNATNEVEQPDTNSDIRVHSLLKSAKEAASINEMDITFGISTGILLGLAICIPTGLLFFDSGLIETKLDKFQFAFTFAAIGLVGGAVIGATVNAILKRGKVALARIERVFRSYNLDISKLEQLSKQHGSLVQTAVRELRDISAIDGDKPL